MIEQKFAEYLYNRLPAVYREEDAKIGEPLHRYIQSLGIGFDKAVEDINNFLYLVDPERCPENLFPYLYESFGIEYFPDIDIKYQRKFLSNIGALIKRRGTYTAVRYLVTTLTGLGVELSYERVYNSGEERILYINLLVNAFSGFSNLPMNVRLIEEFIKDFVPFFITPVVQSTLSAVEEVTGSFYPTIIMSVAKTEIISPSI